MSLLTPARRRTGVEYLDAPDVDPEVVRRSLVDVARANRLFGGAAAVLSEMRAAVHDGLIPQAQMTLLDVGTGVGDIPELASRQLRRLGIHATTIGLDNAPELFTVCRTSACVAGDATQLPFGDASVDVVTISQVLHHFRGERATNLLREANRVARRMVLVSDLRRSRVAAAGLWLASFPLRFHPVSRHDGVVSVLRGFTPVELRAMIADATGALPLVRRHLGFRVTARWVPA